MRKYLIVPVAVALMMATALMTAALLPTPALALTTCGYNITYNPNATPSAQSVQQGTTAYYAVTAWNNLPPQYDPPGDFFSTLSVTGLPAGFTATFTSQGVNALHQPIGQLAVQTTTGHLGTYTLQIVGPSTGCVTIRGVPFTLTVTDTTDTTAPTTTAALAGTKGNNGYYTSAVQVTLAATDPDDTAATIATTYTVDGGAATMYTAPFTVSGDGSHTVAFSSADKAGNAEATKAQTIMIDATAPTAVVGTPDRGPDSNGWYNHAVTVTFNGTDATSGIASCTTGATYSGPDSAAASVPGSCTDKAGNSASGVFALKYDTTAPVTTATPDRAANTHGWYTAPVTVALSATDTLSGVAKSQYNLDNAGWIDYVPGTPVAVSGDLVHTVLFRSVDNAGNREVDGTLTIKIDGTAPTNVAGAAGSQPNAAGWYNKPVGITFSGQDGLSGIATCTSATYSGPDSATATATGTCTDKAGNVSAPATFTFKYDATKPTNVVGTPDRTPNANGWYNALVTVTFSGQDATSGIATCTSATYSGPDSAAASVGGSCTDTAGNVSAPAAFALQYDATKPMVTYTGNAGMYTILDTVAITCKAADNLSGIDATTCKDIAGLAYTYNPGTNTFSATATDKAGNAGSGTTSFTVTVDTTGLASLVNQFVANKGIANSLTTKIAKGNIRPFINEVNAQTGKALTSEQAAILIKWANAL